MAILNVPFYSESNSLNCAPASARAVLDFYGIKKTEKELDDLMETSKNQGTRPSNFIDGIKKLGLKIKFVHKIPENKAFLILKNYLSKEIPVIVSLNLNAYKKKVNKIKYEVSWQGEDFTFHYVVVTGIDNDFVHINNNREKTVRKGKMKLTIDKFREAWYNKYLFGDMVIIFPNSTEGRENRARKKYRKRGRRWRPS
jgi:ABC-type bacteriocin/lantibiotic exporter with double-glycine peptidase domain